MNPPTTGGHTRMEYLRGIAHNFELSKQPQLIGGKEDEDQDSRTEEEEEDV